MDTEDFEDLMRVCRHEAGHAVVGAARGVVVESVTTQPTESSAGVTLFENIAKASPEKNLCVTLGGMAALMVLGDETVTEAVRGARFDLEDASRALKQDRDPHADRPLESALFQQSLTLAKGIIHRHRATTERLASALYDEIELTGDRLAPYLSHLYPPKTTRPTAPSAPSATFLRTLFKRATGRRRQSVEAAGQVMWCRMSGIGIEWAGSFDGAECNIGREEFIFDREQNRRQGGWAAASILCDGKRLWSTSATFKAVQDMVEQNALGILSLAHALYQGKSLNRQQCEAAIKAAPKG